MSPFFPDLRIDGGDDLQVEAMATILAEGTGRRVVVDATSRLAAFADAKLRPLVEAETVLGASLLVVGNNRLRIDRFDLTGGFGALSLTGELDRKNETADVVLRFVASEPDHFALLTDAAASWSALQLSATVNGPYLQPTLALTIEGDALAYRELAIRSIAATVDAIPAGLLTDAESQIDVVADVSIDGLYPGVELPSGWLEPSTRVAASGSITWEGLIVVDSLTVDVPAARLSVEGTAEAWGADGVQLAGGVDVPDLSRFDPSVRGRLAGTGHLSGTLDDPAATARLTLTDSVLAGYPMSEMRLAAEFEHLMRQPKGHVDLEGKVADLPARMAADIRFDDDDSTRVDAIVLQLSSLAAEGAVTLDDNHNANGQIQLSIASLADLAPLIGETLSGTVDASVSLSEVDGRQIVDARGSATDAGLPEIVTAGRAELRLQLSDALLEPVFSARLQADGILAAGQALDRLVATAEGTLGRLTVVADLTGEMLAIDTRADVALAHGETRIELTSLAARHAGVEAALAGLARITLAPEGVLLEGVVVQAEGGRLGVDGRYGDMSDLVVTLSELPLDLSRLAAPDLGLSGRLDGRLQLIGTRDAPRASADLTASGVTLAASRELGIGGVEIATLLDWNGRALNLESTIKGPLDGSMTASASVAAPADPATGLPIVGADSNLTGRISGGARLERLNDLLAARGDRVGGAVSADLSVTGSIADPRIGGILGLTEGSYRSALAGVSLDHIAMRLKGDGEQLTIAKLSARAPNGGVIAMTGGIGIDPDAGFPAELSVRFDDALIINNDIVSSELAGTVGISGELMQSLAVAGRLTVVEAEIRLPERLPPSIPTLEVEEINVPPELAARRPPLPARQTADADGSPPRILLDLAIDAPQRIFVRGRGLDAEVAGEVTVRGDTDAPEIGGGFELRRGFFNALGRRFNFNEGIVTLPQDGSLDADFRFVARTDVDDVTAQIVVSGRASAPRITVESVPDLPQDEILARILFGRRASSLTPFESVRLARSAAELAGLSVGPDVLGGVRGALGLDLIDIERQGDEVESSVLNLGTRIRDRVSVGLQHGLQAGSGRATVQMELTPNVSVETDVGVNSTGRLGVGMEWEY